MSKPTRGSIAADGRGRLLEKRSIALSMRGLCIAVLAAPAGYAHAQDAASPTEEITVTGSRLRRDGMTTPTPVTAVTNEEMRLMAPTLLMDSLAQMPQFRDNAQSHTGSIFTSGGGSNSVNLRGIGSNRTLTLLDGRRTVSSQQAGTIDIAMFPTALIERVEVVTGGASAAYGSDAISGVTNFILNTDFEGVSGNVQAGQTDRHDHNHQQAEFAYGMPIGENGHFVALGRLVRRGRRARHAGPGVVHGLRTVHAMARPCGRGGSTATTAARARSHRAGSIPSGPLAFTQFIDGQPVPLAAGTRIVGNTQIGGGGVDPGEDWTSLRPNDTRHSVFGHFKYDFSDDKMGFVQVHARASIGRDVLPSPLGFAPGWGMTIFNDNPYLPASIVQRMATAGVTSFPYNRRVRGLHAVARRDRRRRRR